MTASPQHAQNTLLLRAKIDASQAVLWHYVSTAPGLACWQADTALGSLDSGGFSLRWPDLGARLDLIVAEQEPGRRLVLKAGATCLTLTVSEGLIELIHQGLDSEDDLQGFESSWRTALSILEVAATKHPMKTRGVSWLFEEVPVPAELLHCYFTESAALGTWLGKIERDLIARSSYHLELFGGMKLSGDVLYAKRDVCLRVSEWTDGVLAMRSLPGPRATRIAALGVSTWEGKMAQSVIPILQGALSRLSQTTQSRES